MKFGIDISPAGSWGDPRTVADLALLAEHSGWDGVFCEDYVFFPGALQAYDPWATLTAIALATRRITLGTLVTPLPRRRPWAVASEAMTIDHLSGGRMVLGVGSGDPDSDDVRKLGEVSDPRTRASMLDEAITVLAGLWSGEEVSFHGSHFDVSGVTLRPRPVQRPRIPIWVGGSLTRAGPRERALRWDGAALYAVSPPDWRDVTGDEVRQLRQTARERRGDDGFVIAVGGRERNEDVDAERAYVAALAEAGADWWHEYLPPTIDYDAARRTIEMGPTSPR